MSLADGRQNFITGLVGLQTEMLTKTADDFQYFAEQQADLIEAFLKSADVKSGISVSVTGSATAQIGSTTSKGKLE